MDAPKFPQIPIPDGSIESIQRSLQVVISTIQMIIGPGAKSQSGDQVNRNMAHVFVQDTMPIAINQGDLWMTQNPKATLSCWDGGQWVHLCDAPP